MVTKTSLGLCAVAALLFSDAAYAANDDTPCKWRETEEIADFTPAVVAKNPPPRYPRQALDEWSEGWTLLEYAVTPKGEVRDIAVVDALGPKDFVKSAVQTVQRWQYTPATRNGVPVEHSWHQAWIMFLIEGSGRSADHRNFVRKYNQARALLRDERVDEAVATIETAFQARLNLYESAMGSFVLSVAYAMKKDWPHALFHARHADLKDGQYLEAEIRTPALALLVDLEARDGGFVEAMCAFERLRARDPAAAAQGTPAATVATQIEAALSSPSPIAVRARLATHPLFDAPAVWRHRLLRSKFRFADLDGEVKSFRLACTGTAHEAAVDDETQWDVPKKAGTCILRVDGAPGATFTLVEED